MGSRKLISAAVVEASDASLSSGLYSWPPLNKSRATETMQQQFKLKRATQSYTPSLPYIWLARTNKTNFKSWCSCNHANPCSTKSDISARVQLHRSMTYQGSLWTSVRPSHLKDSLIRSFLDKEMVVHSMLKLWAHFWQMTKAPLLESDYHNFPWGRSPFELLEKWKAMFVNMTLLQSIISLGLTLLHF